MSREDKQIADALKQAQQLAQDGYCVVPNILDAYMLQLLLDRFGDKTLSQAPNDNFGDSGAFLVADYRDPVMVKLLTWPKTITLLHGLDFSDLKLHNFYVSTKPPGADALPWHSDLFYRYELPAPAELFLIYYLLDTSPDNGCLRVVPKSHLWSHEKRHEQPNNALLRDGEIDVPVKAGDLFVGDRRILHATHANTSDNWRTCITIAYTPNFAKLTEPIQALIVKNQCLPPNGWWRDELLRTTIDPNLGVILPVYDGSAEPTTIE